MAQPLWKHGDPLLTLHDVEVGREGVRSAPLNWTLHSAERIALDCPDGAWREDLVAILTGSRPPARGYLQEARTITVQTDTHLWESMALSRSIQDYLEAPDMPQHVRLGDRRRALWVLLDQMEITPAMTRRPLKLEPPVVQRRFWAVRFLLSRAQLLIGDGIFREQDGPLRAGLQRRWPDLTACVLALAPPHLLPGPVDTRVRLSAEGFVREPAAAPGAL
jgi:hypothetical protein